MEPPGLATRGGETARSLAPSGATVSTGSLGRRFVHPGLLSTRPELDIVATRAAGDDPLDPMALGFAALLASPEADLGWTPHPHETVNVAGGITTTSEKHVKGDARAAYAHALVWAVTGDAAHAELGLEILNAWAHALRLVALDPREDNEAQIGLESAWLVPLFAASAEILRYYEPGGVGAGWDPDDERAFEELLRYLTENAEASLGARNNWGASASLAALAAGTFLDDPRLFVQGLRSFGDVLPGAVSADGQPDELVRRHDCVHEQYSLLALSQAAEIAWHQGLDLYSLRQPGESESRLLLGLEFMSYLFDGGGEFTGWDDDPLDCTGAAMPGYEVPYNHYRNREHVADRGGCISGACCAEEPECDKGMAAFEAAVRSTRPDSTATFFLGWSTLTHGELDRSSDEGAPEAR